MAVARDSDRDCLSQESVAQPPSGQQIVENYSLPLEHQANGRNVQRGLTKNEVTWDKDSEGYVQTEAG